MRIRQLLGIALIAFGTYVLVRGFTFKTKEVVVDLGPIEARTDEYHVLPPWSGAVFGAVGQLLVVSAARRRA
jgi:hypothetical protein